VDALYIDRHGDYVRSLAFSRDGKQVAPDSYDETIRIWVDDSPEMSEDAGDGKIGDEDIDGERTHIPVPGTPAKTR
jgi:hypothetical protein